MSHRTTARRQAAQEARNINKASADISSRHGKSSHPTKRDEVDRLLKKYGKKGD